MCEETAGIPEDIENCYFVPPVGPLYVCGDQSGSCNRSWLVHGARNGVERSPNRGADLAAAQSLDSAYVPDLADKLLHSKLRALPDCQPANLALSLLIMGESSSPSPSCHRNTKECTL